MQKNVAGQKWIIFAFDETDNTPVTGDAANITGNLRLDGGAANAIDDTNPTELEDGYYIFDITQAESNADLILISPESSTVNVQVIGVPGAVWTRPPNFQVLGIESDGDITKVNLLAANEDKTGYALSVTPPTAAEIQAEMEENGASILDTLQDRLTDARAAVLSDWINGGRLDLILDIIAADVVGLNGDAMRGTDGANTTTPLSAVQTQSEVNDALVAFFTSAAQLVDDIWDELLTGATHNIATSAGRRLRDVSSVFVLHEGTAQAGAAGTITLEAGASAIGDYYEHAICVTTGGTGAGQARAINGYDGGTKVATIVPNWKTNPDATTTYTILADSEKHVNEVHTGGISSGSFAAGAIDATALNADAATKIVDDWETQSQADPTGFHVNVKEVNNTAQTANDNGADINTILSRIVGTLAAGTHNAQSGDSFARIGANGASLSALPWNAAWDAEVQSEVADALVAIFLDRLFAVTYDPASKPGVTDALLNELVENDGGVSRYTANALEQAPGGAGSNPNLLLDAEIAVVNTQTEFTLASGSDVDDAYNDQAIVLYDDSNSDYPSVHVVNNYVGATKTVTIDSAPVFTLAADDSVKIFVTAPGTTAPTAAQNRIEMDANSTRLASIDSNSFVGLQGGLNLNFRINEKSGRLIYDKLHAGFKGVLDDGITFVEGVKGKALNFSGSESVTCRGWWEDSKYSLNPVVEGQTGFKGTYFPNLIDVSGEIWMYYSMVRDDDDIITGLSKSTDGGKTFTYFGVVLDTSAAGWDAKRAHDVCVIYDSDDLLYKMWYAGSDDDITSEIGYATSPDGEVWTKQGIVFEKGAPGAFDEGGVTYMTVLKEAGTFYMFYSGYDNSLTYGGMGLATSPDGEIWTRIQTTPVLGGTNFYKGVVKKYDSIYYMLFSTSFTSTFLYVATSTDKINWTINYNPIIDISLDNTDWDGAYLGDAGWYSLDGTEAKIYYSAFSDAGLNDKIGLITIPNVALKAQQVSVVSQYPISIACWIKTTDSGATRGILSLGPTTGPYNGFALYVNSGRLKAQYAIDGVNYVNMTPDIDDGGVINDGSWHHIIFTVDASGGELFVDLVSQNTVAWTGSPGVSTTIEFLKIGEFVNNITGQIDDIRIYDHALSSDERRGIVMGVPYLEDNTLELIRDQETTNDEIAELQGTNFDTALHSNVAIINTGNASWGELTGSNAITINIKDQNTDNVVECVVEIWDAANTVFYERKTTDSSGNTSHNIDTGTYTVRIHKAGYIFTDQTLVVSAAATVNYTGTTVIIGTPADPDACRVYDYAFEQDDETPVASLDACCFIASLPYDYDGKLHSGQRKDVIYDSETGLFYWDIVKGATVKFHVKHFGYINKSKVIPALGKARLSDIED